MNREKQIKYFTLLDRMLSIPIGKEMKDFEFDISGYEDYFYYHTCNGNNILNANPLRLIELQGEAITEIKANLYSLDYAGRGAFISDILIDRRACADAYFSMCEPNGWIKSNVFNHFKKRKELLQIVENIFTSFKWFAVNINTIVRNYKITELYNSYFFQKTFNTDDSVSQLKSTNAIISLELERERIRFTNGDAFAKAVKETTCFFNDNAYRTKEPIKETIKAKDAIIIAMRNIKIQTGRISQFAYKADTDYLEFIKSLFFMYKDDTIKQLGERMEKKN